MKLLLDEGFQFGLGVFETIAVEDGRPVLLNWHLERLNHSMKELGIPRIISPADFTLCLTQHLESNGISTDLLPHHAVKLMVSEHNTVLSIRPNPYTEESRRKGFQLGYSKVRRNETSPLTRHKTLNYGDNILEKRAAASCGLDDLIFLNSREEICEGSVSNIFFVSKGRIYTPPVFCGLLPGIMRRFVLQHAEVTEIVLTRASVDEMQECFVTNSLMGIMPVRRLGSKLFDETGTALKLQRLVLEQVKTEQQI